MNDQVVERKPHELEVRSRGMRELAVMDQTGDTKTIWDPRNEDEVDVARDTFNKLKKKGYLIYKVNAEGGKGKAMSEFDASAEKMIAVPNIVGG